MPDYDPLTISDEDLKKLSPAERGAVYKARAAARAGGTAPTPSAATPPAPSSAAATPSPAGAAASPAAGASTTGAGAANGGGAAGTASAGATASRAGAAGTPGAGASSAAGAGAAGTPGAGASSAAGAAGATASSAAGAAGTSGAGASATGAGAAKGAGEAAKEPPFVTAVLAAVDGATWQWRHGYAEIKVPRDALLTAANSLKAQGFDYLSFITEVDWQDRLELVYHLYSYDYAAQPLGAILRCDLPRDGMPSVASLTAVWPGAEFMEREAYEMMGIRFLGHPDLRRILLPDDFVGFPMRRDYTTDYAYVTVKSLAHESD